MFNDPFERQQRWINLGSLGIVAATLAWFFSPGLPVLWGPSADDSVRNHGRELFERTWSPYDEQAGGDGLGPVFNGRSCVECHFQGGVGGGGSNKHNVIAFDVHPANQRPRVESGVLHAFAVDQAYREREAMLASRYPIVKGIVRVSDGCQIQLKPFDPVHKHVLNSTALFGAGWIDRISSKAITKNRFDRLIDATGKELALDFSSIPAGKVRTLPDGRIGRFGWKAQFATLEEFVANACAVEIGLGTPSQPQSKPIGQPDYPEKEPDLNKQQFTALVSFVSTLPRPRQVLPDSPTLRAECERGEVLFRSIGCAVCHVPDLGGVKAIYSDLLLHRIHHTDDPGGGYGPSLPELPMPDNHPQVDEWRTPPLWGVADSAPYMHDGSAPTLHAAIERHRGAAASVSDAYRKLPADDRRALIAFLKSLKAPADAPPLRPAESALVSR